MSYCTITDVQALNSQRDTYGAATNPSLTEVNGFITQIGNELDSLLLTLSLTVPVITPAEFVGALALANAQGAAALAEMAQFPEAQGTMGGSPHGQQLWAMYEKFKTWLTGKDSSITVVGGITTILGHVSPQSSHERTEANETEPEETHDWQKPRIRKNMEF